MIWIASFPRSGNTYLRNILFEVYGLESSTFHMDPDYSFDEQYESYPFVKTHLLPNQLLPNDAAIKAIYLVRDGRDSMCSIAHHRKDIVAPGSDYYENLQAAIIAEKGSFFGGWSKNVNSWIERAHIIIRYEDLIANPQKETERIGQLLELPTPDWSKLPTFKKLKSGIAEYGSGKNKDISEEQMKSLSERNFRKGKAGSWKTEMPLEMQELFWSYHGETMEKLGYSWSGDIVPINIDLDYKLLEKLGQITKTEPEWNILMEASKLASNDNDGVKRYQNELLKALWPIAENPMSRWNFSLLFGNEVKPLIECKELIFKEFSLDDINTSKTTHSKSLFQVMEETFVGLIPDMFVSFLRKNNITIFHRIYNGTRDVIFRVIKILFRILGFIETMLYQLKSWILQRRKHQQSELNKFDLIHLPLMQHYRCIDNQDVSVVVTMHDVTHRLFPQFHTDINIANAEKGLKFVQESNADIIAVSESTLNDVKNEINISADQLHLVYEAANSHKFYYSNNTDDNLRVLKKYGIDKHRPYFLSLSTIEPRKNLSNTIKAFTLLLEENPDLPIHLIIAGKKGWLSDSLFIHNKLLSERIIFTGFVDDKDLAALYSEAKALCYLSFYEGFGLPALEAMRCKTPVLFGNNSSLPEVVGKGGIGVDANDLMKIKGKMLVLCKDDVLRNDLSRKALQQSLKFSWRKVAIETLGVYEKIIKSKNKTKANERF